MKAIKAPSQAVLKILGAAVMILNKTRKQPKWNECQEAILNPRKFIENLRSIQNKIDEGEDFSKVLDHTAKLLEEPDMNARSARAASVALEHLLAWIIKIEDYGKAKQAELFGDNIEQKNLGVI